MIKWGTLFFLHLFLAASALGEVIALEKGGNLFNKPNRQSKIISVLMPKQRVRVAKKKYGEFLKVLVQVNGRKLIGYILADLTEADDFGISNADWNSKPVSLNGKLKLGVSVGFILHHMEKNSFSSGATDNYEISDFQSLTNNFGAFISLPRSNNKSWNLFAGSQPIGFKGKAVLTASGSPVNAKYNVDLKRDLIFFGADCRFFKNELSKFWWNIGAEYDYGTKATVKITDLGAGIENSFEEKSGSWWLIRLGFGWDYQIGNHFLLSPSLIGGVVVNNDPAIFKLEAGLSLGYGFN